MYKYITYRRNGECSNATDVLTLYTLNTLMYSI